MAATGYPAGGTETGAGAIYLFTGNPTGELSASEAAMGAAASRLRPILMTASAALSGFFPLVIATGAGALSQRSLGAVIFGGLLVATVLSLFVVPAFYVLMKNLEAQWFPASQPGQPVGEPPVNGETIPDTSSAG